MAHRVGAQFADGRSHQCGRDGGRQRWAESDGDGVGQPLGQLPEEAAFFEAEHTAPHAVQVHRYHRHVQSGEDALESTFKREQVTRPADGAFGENADDMPGLEFGASALDGRRNAGFVTGRDWDRMHPADHRVNYRQIEIRTVHHEAHEAVHTGAHEQAVHH